jgi:hypothetical protein
MFKLKSLVSDLLWRLKDIEGKCPEVKSSSEQSFASLRRRGIDQT